MVLENKNLGAVTNVFPTSSPRFVAKDNKALKLESITGAPILEVGTPLAEGATPGTYKIWSSNAGSADDIMSAFVQVRHQSSATGETLVVAMIAGDAHRDDIPLPSGEVQAEMDAHLRLPSLASRGLRIFGLADLSL